MLPQGLATLYAFLGLVAPGLLYGRIREQDSPQAAQSAFREIGRIVVSSLVFTWLSVISLALVSQALPWLFVDLAAWTDQGRAYLGDNFWLVTRSLTLEVGLACLYAFFGAKYLSHQGDTSRTVGRRVVFRTPMYEMLHTAMEGDERPWVRVETTEGATYWGYVYRHTLNEVAADTLQIALCGPGLAIRAKDAPPGHKPKEQDYWQYVWLKASDVCEIRVFPKSEPSTVVNSDPAPIAKGPIERLKQRMSRGKSKATVESDESDPSAKPVADEGVSGAP